MKELRIGMIGYGFMGRAHSNAYRQVAHFFDVDPKPRMVAICGRDEAAAKAAAEKAAAEKAAAEKAAAERLAAEEAARRAAEEAERAAAQEAKNIAALEAQRLAEAEATALSEMVFDQDETGDNHEADEARVKDLEASADVKSGPGTDAEPDEADSSEDEERRKGSAEEVDPVALAREFARLLQESEQGEDY
jgi:hypothetical protein